MLFKFDSCLRTVSEKGGQMVALRIVNIPEDEDMFNVATWEEGGTKQWCKFDLPGPEDFWAFISAKASTAPDGTQQFHCQRDCGDITHDPRYHKIGVPKVFYTAHHAVDPPTTKTMLKELEDLVKTGKVPPNIMYRGVFYKDGKELLKANPDISCII